MYTCIFIQLGDGGDLGWLVGGSVFLKQKELDNFDDGVYAKKSPSLSALKLRTKQTRRSFKFQPLHMWLSGDQYWAKIQAAVDVPKNKLIFLAMNACVDI